MKHLGLAAGLAALLSSGAAMGADINGSLKDGADIFSAPKEVNWTGFYVGVQGGYGNANHNLSIHDYFKDYCSGQTENPEFNRFDEHARTGTLENRKQAADGASDGLDIYDVPNPEYSAANDVNNDGQEDGGDKGSAFRFIKGAVNTSAWADCAAVQRTYGGGRYGQNHDAGDESNARIGAINSSGNLATVAGDSREVASIDGINSHGFIGGGRIGFDYARGRLLFGAFADYNFSGMETNASVAGIGNFDLRKEDEWTIGGRIGYIVAPRTLAYVLAGYTQTEYSVGGLDNAVIAPLFTSVRSGATFDGVTVGGGIEFALAANVFFGLEYQHTFYGEETLIDAYNADLNQGIKVIDDLDEDKIMATLKIKLNGLGLD